MKDGNLIPSMFHRRLLLLASLTVIGMVALGSQLFSLTIVQGGAFRDDALSRLINQQLIPTTRGRILDRRGRVLAADAPSYALHIDYRVLTDQWAYSTAARAARIEYQDVWRELTAAQRDRLIERDYLPQCRRRLERLWGDIAHITGASHLELDQRRNRIIAQVQHTWAVVSARNLQRARQENRAKELTVEPMLRDVAVPIREQREAHTLLANLDDAAAFALRRLADSPDAIRDSRGRPLVEVVDSGSRVYPQDRRTVTLSRAHLPHPITQDDTVSIDVSGVAWHLLGSMRDHIEREDVEREPPRFRTGPHAGEINLRGYRAGDSVGNRGLETFYEDRLRGTSGLLRHHRDTGEEIRIAPVPGRDLQLTIDIDLQTAIQAIMDPSFGLTVAQPWHRSASLQTAEHQNPTIPDGTPLTAAAVVLDIRTGEILAMVTNPTVDRDAFDEDQTAFTSDEVNRPLVSRAIQMPLPPGSIIKPLILCMGVTEGVWDIDRTVECHGHLLPNRNNIYRCWIYRPKFGFQTHFQKYGKGLGPSMAIAESCNIFFYTVARELGPSRIAKWYRRFGVGRSIIFGLPDEAQYPGQVGSPNRALQLQDAIQMGIGQGPVTWTPMHAANAHATLARGGVFLPPTIVRSADLLVEHHAVDLHLDPQAVEAALDGMRQSAQESYGTSHHLSFQGWGREPTINVPGVVMRAKTGTAQAPSLVRNEPDGTMTILRSGDHAWYVGLVAAEGDAQPRFAVAVFVEYGGSGGRVAGPIANQIIWQLRKLAYL
ncbi:MAG: hypothetical protein KAS72_03900 [Phycisphaerales bacterium]|nr:hypothetical protein [Phycisphaerales bacterium]